jgi:hypothetical protein
MGQVRCSLLASKRTCGTARKSGQFSRATRIEPACLSRYVQEIWHVRFLGGLGPATAPGYPPCDTMPHEAKKRRVKSMG